MDSVWDSVWDREPRPTHPAWGRMLGPQAPLSALPIPTFVSQLGPPSAQIRHGSNALSLPAPVALVTCSWKMAMETDTLLALLSGGSLPAAWPGPGVEGGVLSPRVSSQGWVPTGFSQEHGRVGCEVLHIQGGQQGPWELFLPNFPPPSPLPSLSLPFIFPSSLPSHPPSFLFSFPPPFLHPSIKSSLSPG